MTELIVGTKVVYVGDIANSPGEGSITDVTTSKWGTNLKIVLNDGRVINIGPSSFAPGPGTRFFTKIEHDEKRRLQMEQMEKEMKAYLASREGQDKNG